MPESNEEKTLKLSFIKNIDGKSYRLNSDANTVDRVAKAMIKRKEKSGEYYCPYRIPSGDKEKD